MYYDDLPDAGPTDADYIHWNEANDHADDYDPADGELDEMGQAIAAVYERVAPELAACEAAAKRARDTANSGSDYELAVRFDALHAKLREVTHQTAGADG
ncbi:hypothetical protein ABZ671_01595 [Micromonospora sp. NPDC006766]|uniref:hypothetical protein n=1 Tax=Micromonospora sp. NPDC006766 TaxID=3154778 RepID=UPI0033E0C166